MWSILKMYAHYSEFFSTQRIDERLPKKYERIFTQSNINYLLQVLFS